MGCQKPFLHDSSELDLCDRRNFLHSNHTSNRVGLFPVFGPLSWVGPITPDQGRGVGTEGPREESSRRLGGVLTPPTTDVRFGLRS